MLFIKTNSSWIIFESVNALEINTMLFNFDFATNTSLFFFFFLFIALYFLNFCSYCTDNPMVKLVIPIVITGKETKVEIEVH